MNNINDEVKLNKTNGKEKSYMKTYISAWVFSVLCIVAFVLALCAIQLASTPQFYFIIIGFSCFGLFDFIALILCLVLLNWCDKSNTVKIFGLVTICFVGSTCALFYYVYLGVIKGMLSNDNKNPSNVFDSRVNNNRYDVFSTTKTYQQAPVTPKSSIQDKLAKLDSLKHKGLIDDSDYQRLKDDVIKSNL